MRIQHIYLLPVQPACLSSQQLLLPSGIASLPAFLALHFHNKANTKGRRSVGDVERVERRQLRHGNMKKIEPFGKKRTF